MRIPGLMLFGLIAGGCSSAVPPDEPLLDPTPERIELSAKQAHGQVLYDGLCWGCHGSGGHGDGPAASADTPLPPTFHTQNFSTAAASSIEARFRSGISLSDDSADHPHTRYVMGLLRIEYLEDVMEYVRLLSYPPEVPGSALAGAAIYSRRCVSCHGTSGDGSGPLADHYVDTTPVADLTTNPLIASADWDRLYTRLSRGTLPVHGTQMVAWDKILPSSTIWDLVAYVATFQPNAISPPPWGTP